MPSSVANADRDEAANERIVEAMHFLAQQGSRGMAWLDPHLRVVERFGWMTETLTPGAPIVETFHPLVGFEDDLLALKGPPVQKPLVLANLLPAGSGHGRTRMTISVYWRPEQSQFLLVISRAASFAEIEYRLAAETRARAIAEAEVAAQARVVQRINHELATANSDLREFASVISHDLRAPLRGLRYASTDAKTAISAGDPTAAEEHIDRALALTQRMGAMLSGLLDYARAGRKADVAEIVRTGDLAAEIASSIAEGCTHQISIEGEWPTIETAAEPLDIVLRNLIDNAAKHHDRDRGRIIVSAQPDGDHLRISVSDDGPGIPSEWHSAVFLPFRQMGDSSETEGAGIGLALVKKTVDRFGGNITLESDPERHRGARFNVSWPLTLPT